MAANKFATVLHRNTHKFTVILVYTVLEWTLIALLLLNALFSYLIAKFASFFALHPPCIFCSRVDHVFGTSYRDLLCDAHAGEVSRLGYCSRHLRLAEAGDMCEDCSSSSTGTTMGTGDRTVSLMSWMERSESGEKDLRCSCCDVVLESGYLLLKPSWGVLEINPKGNFVEEKEDQMVFPCTGGSDAGLEGEEDKDGAQSTEDGEVAVLLSEPEQQGMAFGQFCDTRFLVDEASLQVHTMCLMELLDVDEGRLVPVELIDWTTLTDNPVYEREDDGEIKHGEFERDYAQQISISVPVVEVMDSGVPQILEVVGLVEEHPSVPTAEGSIGGCSAEYPVVQAAAICGVPGEGVDVEVVELTLAGGSGELQGVASEDEIKTMDAETNCEISIGSEICHQEQINRSHLQEPVSVQVGIEVECSEDYNVTIDKSEVIKIENLDTVVRGVDCVCICQKLNDVEEERAPETPSSMDGIHAVHKRFFFERRESGAESFDGSVASEIEGGEPLTMDRLKAALNSERKALGTLYAELEEERSASAVAANQTMAMITRLQEEKSAMQMEALQYQRMMEEQSEYDQEALQLLNELMMKREKEKHDLEKELEVYRKKVLRYEAKERKTMVRSNGNGRSTTSSASSSGEDSDDTSFDCHEDGECFNSLDESNQHTPTDAVLRSRELPEAAKHLNTLDESLDEFEEDRLSILEQLKALEEKLFTSDAKELSRSLESMDHFSEENGHLFNGDYNGVMNGNGDYNGVTNGFSNDFVTNGKLHGKERSTGIRGKNLLPLFDAFSMENGDGLCSKPQETYASAESVPEKLAIAEEVDNVFERLQALEADREFLKYCIRSMKNGDKGMDLLQEILQHLRDLRNVEFQARNAGDAFASLSV